jgi:uncharacterized repeat protein (TIGR03803 family)
MERKGIGIGHLGVGVAALLGIGASAVVAAGGPREKVLWRFSSNPDGRFPNTGVLNLAGALYGTTISGGTAGKGAVYQLTPPAAGSHEWTEAILHSFTGAPDGDTVNAGLIVDQHGALYGVTAWGGSGSSCSVVGGAGCGVVYQLTPPASPGAAWTETVLYSFAGGTDGWSPSGTLVLDGSGALYGTTAGGGAPRTSGRCSS